jgi:hypothetical protein
VALEAHGGTAAKSSIRVSSGFLKSIPVEIMPCNRQSFKNVAYLQAD